MDLQKLISSISTVTSTAILLKVLFDKNGEWYSTSWDVRKNELPVAVTTTISNQYAGYQIDDAEYFEMAAGTAYYLIELEGNNTPDINIKIAADGTILK